MTYFFLQIGHEKNMWNLDEYRNTIKYYNHYIYIYKYLYIYIYVYIYIYMCDDLFFQNPIKIPWPEGTGAADLVDGLPIRQQIRDQHSTITWRRIILPWLEN